MNFCLIQPTGSSPSMFFQASPDFSEQILQRGKKNLRCTSISSKGENQWEPRRYRTEPNLQQTGGLGCSIPRCFIAMKHTSQHQVPYPSRTAPSGLKWSLRQLWQNVTSRQRLSAMTSTKFTKKESHNGTMLLLFPHPHVTSLFEHATQTWMGHFQFLARTSALPLWIWSWSWGCWVSDELHHAAQQTGAWIGWNDQLWASRSTKENALKLGDAALKLSDTNNFPKPGKQQCNNLNHTLTNKYQWYQDTGWDSLVGLMMVVRVMLVQIGLNLCMPQAWRKARYSFHRLVVNSSTAFTSDLTLPFSAHSITSWQNLDIGCTQVRNLS